MKKRQYYEQKMKEQAYYNTAYNALYENCMEIDRQILNLSVGAIGILTTCFYRHLENITSFIIWISSIVCFMISTLLVFIVLHHNTVNLEKSLNNCKQNKRILPYLDLFLRIFFMSGIILAFILTLLNSGFCISINKL